MPVQPSEKEEEYFARMEFERKRKAEEERQKRLKDEERKRLKDLHYMRCPKCGMQLVEIDYKNIKIDRCSDCGGLWFDAKELDTVMALERSALDRLYSIFK